MTQKRVGWKEKPDEKINSNDHAQTGLCCVGDSFDLQLCMLEKNQQNKNEP